MKAANKKPAKIVKTKGVVITKEPAKVDGVQYTSYRVTYHILSDEFHPTLRHIGIAQVLEIYRMRHLRLAC